MAMFANAGQDCCARSRILVERPAMDRFMDALEEAVDALKVGDPLDEATEMGPLISAGQRESVSSFVPDDAPVAIRGSAPDGPGFWFAPTVLCPVAPTDRAGDGGDLRAGRDRDPVRRRGRGDPAGQRHDLRAAAARSGRATARGRCASRARSRAATSR